ncbi:uncharacterized protein LOC110731623 isoform X2 [Chenopodium quinoa]|uniref:uncharacterized protein LOC110731623 isoform X2 n=1 Tax=Chenopodium quinoa TaxID=63459 RepID=UPI000B791DE2|nr:uncharacterized protein LOC110731623 isoform X2 [Chenopodium quinoa]
MSLRRKLQSNAVVHIWALLASGFFAGAAYFLHKVRKHRIAQGGSDILRDVLLYALLVVLSGVHIVVLHFPLRLRRSRIARMTPSPFYMGLGCTVTALVPLACTIDDGRSSGFRVYVCSHVTLATADGCVERHSTRGVATSLAFGHCIWLLMFFGPASLADDTCSCS